MYPKNDNRNSKKGVCYDNLYNKASRYPYLVQHGRGYHLTPFMGKKHQRGYGLGNIISGLFRTVIPLVKPVLKSAARNIGKRMIKGGVSVAKNVLKGENIKRALKREAQQSMSELGSDAISFVTKKKKKYPCQKKSKREKF